MVTVAKEGETDKDLDARTPLVYLIGSRNNAAMYANTLTSTSEIQDEHGIMKTLGRTYSSLFNAQ